MVSNHSFDKLLTNLLLFLLLLSRLLLLLLTTNPNSQLNHPKLDQLLLGLQKIVTVNQSMKYYINDEK